MLDEKIDRILEKRKEELIHKYHVEGTHVITYAPYNYHAPLEVLEAAGVEYLSWDWFVRLYGIPKQYLEEDITSQYLSDEFCLVSRSNFTLSVKYMRPEVMNILTYTCDPYTKMWEYMDRAFPVFYFNLPRENTDDMDVLEYWYKQQQELKKFLEDNIKEKIGEESIKKAIDTEEQICKKLKTIRLGVHRKVKSPISCHEAYRLLTLRNCLGQKAYLNLLDETLEMLGEIPKEREDKSPTFLVVGSLIDEWSLPIKENIVPTENLLKFIEDMGCKTIEGLWTDVFIDSDRPKEKKEVLECVGDITINRGLHPCITDITSKRRDKYEKLGQLFDTKGVIFLNYKSCTLFAIESRVNEKEFMKKDIPYLHVQMTGETQDIDDVHTNIRTFIEVNK